MPAAPCRLRRYLAGDRPKADGIARLPKVDGAKPQRSRLKSHPIGFFHLDIAEVHTEQGRLHLSGAVDRTSKFAFAQLHERATRKIAADFLHALVAAVPYHIHTVLTDNGTQLVDRTPTNLAAEAAGEAYRAAWDGPRVWLVHAFDHACEQHGLDHRTTKPGHPLGDRMIAVPAGTDRARYARWTNGQVERMNRTLKGRVPVRGVGADCR